MKAIVTIVLMFGSLTLLSQQKAEEIDVSRWFTDSKTKEWERTYDPMDVAIAIDRTISVCIDPFYYYQPPPVDMMVRHYFAISYWN